MSMRDNPMVDYGMILTKAQLGALVEFFAGEQLKEDERADDLPMYDCEELLTPYINIVSYGDFSGEAVPVISDEGFGGSAGCVPLNEVCYIPLDKESSLTKAAYKTEEEAKREIADKIHCLFPVTIYQISGVYRG